MKHRPLIGSGSTNTYIAATDTRAIEELLGTVSSIGSVPRIYSEGRREKLARREEQEKHDTENIKRLKLGGDQAYACSSD
jgi:hypothetical protein